MKALSIRQPWAWLIVNGHKDVENRDWRYLPDHYGSLLIHAAKRCTRHEYEAAADFAKSVDPSIEIPPLNQLERGGIIGRVYMVTSTTNSDSKWFVGRIGLLFSMPEKLKFFPCKGQLGFFNVDMKI